jgi:hypothetical protein
MPVYTYLMQVLPEGGENWGNLLEPRTGTPVAGTFGVVEADESGLPRVAREIMERWSSSELPRRVSFWEGRLVNESLYTSEVLRMVYSDGRVLDADAIARDASGRSERHREPERHQESVRPGCPHSPHDGACGHEGDCAFAHFRQDCPGVRPVCPACLNEERASVVPGIVAAAVQSGDDGLVLRCSSCEQLSFQVDAGLICGLCQWLVPHVNEELASRFALNGGAFAPPPGSCPGCGDQLPRPGGPFSFGCPKCGESVFLTLDLTPGSNVTTMCPNKECKQYIKIPQSIWCPECGQHLRPLPVVRKLTLEANDLRPAAQSNVREDEATRLARRLGEAAISHTRRYSYLTEDQKKIVRDKRYLDSLAASSVTADEWIRDVVEIRAAGRDLYGMGGMRAMLDMHQRVLELGSDYQAPARIIENYWDGIGDWLG